MSSDLLIFYCSEPVSSEHFDVIRSRLAQLVPETRVVVLGPGEAISMPMDTRHLCECVDKLQKTVAELIQLNQNVLSVLIEMVDSDESERDSHGGYLDGSSG